MRRFTLLAGAVAVVLSVSGPAGAAPDVAGPGDVGTAGGAMDCTWDENLVGPLWIYGGPRGLAVCIDATASVWVHSNQKGSIPPNEDGLGHLPDRISVQTDPATGVPGQREEVDLPF